jgi:glycosidase
MCKKYAFLCLWAPLLLGLLLLVACAPQNQSSQLKTPAAANVATWYAQSYDFFFNTSHTDTQNFAKALNESLALTDSKFSSSTQALSTKNTLTDSLNSKTENPAFVAIKKQLRQQFIAHQFASFGDIYLSQSDLMFTQQNPQWASYIQSLTALGETVDVFTQGNFEIYAANDTSGLFAYKRMQGNTRAFIAFNFSFDTHELPLPFGFMASTKVRMWQSDATKIQTFVTSQALTIRPYTAVIVIVG